MAISKDGRDDMVQILIAFLGLFLIFLFIFKDIFMAIIFVLLILGVMVGLSVFSYIVLTKLNNIYILNKELAKGQQDKDILGNSIQSYNYKIKRESLDEVTDIALLFAKKRKRFNLEKEFKIIFIQEENPKYWVEIDENNTISNGRY